MIKNVILDVGNVLVDYCWEKHLASFGFPADIAERVAKATALSEDWEEYDRGVLTDAEVLNRFIENDPGVEKEIRMYVENLSGVIEVYPYAEEWIRAKEIRQGYTFSGIKVNGVVIIPFRTASGGLITDEL